MSGLTIPESLVDEARGLCGDDEAAARALAAAACYYELRPDDVLGPSRLVEVVQARKVWMCALHEEGYGSVPIGALARRDHSTVLHDVLWGKRDIAAGRDGMDEAMRFVTTAIDQALPHDDGGLVHAAAELAGVAVPALLGDAARDTPRRRRLQRLVYYLLTTEHCFTPRQASDLVGVADVSRLRGGHLAQDLQRADTQALLRKLRARAATAERLDSNGRIAGKAPRLCWPGRKVLQGKPAPHDKLTYEKVWHKSDQRHLSESWRFPDLRYA